MTETVATQPVPRHANADAGSGLPAIARLLRSLVQAEATGDLAALRRMDRKTTPPAAFFRLIARAGFAEMSDIDNVRRWVGAVHVMAQRPDTLRTDLPLGEALVHIGVSEQRLDMLLNARGEMLFDVVRRLSLRLSRSEAIPVEDAADGAVAGIRLVLPRREWPASPEPIKSELIADLRDWIAGVHAGETRHGSDNELKEIRGLLEHLVFLKAGVSTYQQAIRRSTFNTALKLIAFGLALQLTGALPRHWLN